MNQHDIAGSTAIDDLVDARVRRMLDHAPAGCFEADPDGAFTFVNQQWCDLTGHEPDSAVGSGWTDAVHLEDRDRVIKLWQFTVERAQSFAMEFRTAPADTGEMVWLAVSAAPVFDHDGTLTGYIGWASDVSMKVQLEEYLERALMDQVKVAGRLRREENRIRLLVENISEGIWSVDADLCTKYANPRMAGMVGCDGEDLLDRSLLDFLDEGDARTLDHRLLESHAGDRVLLEVTLRHHDGRTVPVMLAAAVLGDARSAGAMIVVTDLTQIRQAQAMLHTIERQFQAVFERAPLGISIVALDGHITEVNEAICEMTGRSRETLIGELAVSVLGAEDESRARHAVSTQLFAANAPHVSIEHRLARDDMRDLWVLSDSSLVHDDDGEPLFIVTLSTDITERKMFEERLAHEASHDALTGLPNRSLLRELLEQATARTQRRATSMAVMFVDLDHFKSVNDELGHAAGDDVLMQAASRIRSSLRVGDVVARYGGDEFVVVCEDVGGLRGAEIIAGRICDSMRAPFVIGDEAASIGASIGVVLGDGSEDIDILLCTADQTLYRAKDNGRGRAEFESAGEFVAATPS